MKKVIFILAILSCFFISNGNAQYYNQTPAFLKANSRWSFGDWGVNMNTNPISPFPIRSLFISDTSNRDYENIYNTLVSSSTTGELRFSFNGVSCFDKNFRKMPHGQTLRSPSDIYLIGDYTGFYDERYSIIPFIGDSNKYYCIYPSDRFEPPSNWPVIPNNLSLKYCVVDMSLNNGLGDVSEKDLPIWKYNIDTAVTSIESDSNVEAVYKLLTIPGNNCDIWLLLFTYKINSLLLTGAPPLKCYSYHIDANGISNTPQVVSFEYFSGGFYQFPVALMAVSPDRKSILGHGSFGNSKISSDSVSFLFRFDPETGEIAAQAKKIFNLQDQVLGDINYFTYSPDNKNLILSTTNSSDLKCDFAVYDVNNNFKSVNEFVNPTADFSAEYLGAAVFLKNYGSNVYFNMFKDTFYQNIDYTTFTVGADTGRSLFPNTGLSFLSNTGPSWAQPTFGYQTDLLPFCLNDPPLDIVYPYGYGDTIPDVYLDTVLCSDNPSSLTATTLYAKSGFSDYIWNDGTTGDSKTITTPGKYWVHYKASCNSRVDTFLIQTKMSTPILPADTVVCEQRFPFYLNATGAEQYLWFDNDVSSKTEILQPGTYWLQYFKDGCTQTDTISVTSEYCPCHVSVPSGFTPNGDGLNDYFKPSIAPGCVPSEYVLKVYNRWGQMVYSSFNEIDLGWNGQYKNGIADVGTYFYELKFKSRFLSEPYYKKGEFVLVK